MKTKLKVEDIGEQGCVVLQVLGRSGIQDRIGQSALATESRIPRTTVRRLLDRLVLFGLVDEVGRSPGKTFLLTKEGIAFARKFHLLDEAPVVSTEPMAPPPSMVKWLRAKADELNAMADHLSHYE